MTENKLTLGQIALIDVLDKVYKTVSGDRRLFVMALIQNGNARDEKEANKIVDGYNQIKSLMRKSNAK